MEKTTIRKPEHCAPKIALAECVPSKIQCFQERKTMMQTFRRLWSDDEGQDLVEYALLVFLISVAAITILTTLGTDVSKVFSTAASAMTAS
ncbi:MAG: Flp family type IVb pilin [Terriglobales bacterium]